MKALKIIGLALAAMTLSGCAGLMGESDKEFDEGIATNSYAWNVEHRMLGEKEDNMPKDPDWTTLDKKMLNKENGYYLPLNSEFAPHREDLKRDLELSSTSEKASEHLLGWGNVSANVGGAIGGNAATAGALTGVALMTKAIFGTNGYVDPVMDFWLHDQTLFYVPVKNFAKGNDADYFVINSFKKAVAKADKRLVIKEEKDCHLIRLLISEPGAKEAFLHIEQHRFEPGTDPKMPQCKREPQKDTELSYLPGWMNHGIIDEKAWAKRIHGTLLIGSQRNKIAAIAKYLPDNFYSYIAPRIDDKTKKVVHPVVIDNKGMHEFIAPVSAK